MMMIVEDDQIRLVAPANVCLATVQCAQTEGQEKSGFTIVINPHAMIKGLLRQLLYGVLIRSPDNI